MKIRFLYILLAMLPVSLCFADSKVTNLISLVPAWLDRSIPSYSIYRDSSLPQEFRDVIPAVCQYIQPSTVLGQYYDFNYTDEISAQTINNGKCEIKYEFRGSDNPIAMCASKFKPNWDSPDWQYVGIITEFDILINSYYTWVTGQFGTPDVYDREHSMRHEFAHSVGCGHTTASQLMDITYNESNPVRNISDIDYDIYKLVGNPAGEIIDPQISQDGYCDVLLKQGGQVVIEALKPSYIETSASGLGYYSLNEDLSYHDYIETDNEYDPVQEKYVLNWLIDTTKYSNKAYNIRAMSSGYHILNEGKPYIDKFPNSELKVRFSNLTLRSPEYNKEYSIYAPLAFKVYGNSENAVVPISDINNIGTVEYLLEKEGTLWNTEVFTEVTNATTNFEFTKDLSTILDLETGDYLVSVTVRDQQDVVIAEIEEMPIRINTRSIEIQDPTSEEFMIYDFDLVSWYYTTWFVISGRFYNEGLENKDIQIPSPPELYDVQWCEENGVQASVYSEDYPSALRVPDGTYIWTADKWPEPKDASGYAKSDDWQYAESNLMSTMSSEYPQPKDEQGINWLLDSDFCLRPGLYTFLGNVYYKKDYQNGIYTKLAETDTLNFLVPSWKMKTRPDYRFGIDRIHFRKTEDIEVCIWRPVGGLPANPTTVYLYSENKEFLISTQTVSYADGIGTSKVASFSTDNLDPGFYELVAVETDYYTGIEIKFEKEIQVCPLYVNWESGGAWPSDWPGMSDGYWRIDSFVNNDLIIKAHSVENNYTFTTETEVLMNTQRTSPGVILDKTYDAFMHIYIGIERINTFFKKLQAVYQVSISVNDKSTWDILKTATAEEWTDYNWPDELNRWCFADTGTAIKNTHQPIYIKLTGIDPSGTLRDTTFTEGVCYDEIMIAYVKDEYLLEAPENLAAQFYNNGSKYDAVQLTWDNSPDYKTGRYYLVYRDGILISDMFTSNTFLDYGTIPDRTYNYIVTLVDPTVDSDSPCYESPKAGNSIDFYTGLLSPSGLVITEESPNIRLAWSAVDGASGYKVYSCDTPYGMFLEDTTGVFDGEEWVAPLNTSRLFYYVVAVSGSKEIGKAIINKSRVDSNK